MNDLDILARILLALSFGAILGLETETRVNEALTTEAKRKAARRIGGVRTYTVLSLLGAIGGLLFAQGYPIFAYLVFIGVFLLVLAAYVLNVEVQKAFGMTTEIAIMITVLVGFAATANVISLEILIVIIVLLTFILSQKRGIGLLVSKIAHAELIDVVTFAIVALVIFPFLPNQDILMPTVGPIADLLRSIGLFPAGIEKLVLLNPFKLWQYVLLISGFNLVGYFAARLLGKTRGLLLSGVFGGLVSSTSTTISLAIRARSEKDDEHVRKLAGAGLIANATSFLPLLALAASASLSFAQSILSVSVLFAIVSILIGVWYLRKDGKHRDEVQIQYTPFSLMPAIKFSLLLTTVKIVLQLVNIVMGHNAFVVATALSGIAGMDVAVISLGEVISVGEIAVFTGVITYFGANIVNFIAKTVYSRWEGTSKFALRIGTGLLLTAIAGAVLLYVMWRMIA